MEDAIAVLSSAARCSPASSGRPRQATTRTRHLSTTGISSRIPRIRTTAAGTTRALEGLTISPDGKSLWVMLQSASRQDGGASSSKRRNTRFLRYGLQKAMGRVKITYEDEYAVPAAHLSQRQRSNACCGTVRDYTTFQTPSFLCWRGMALVEVRKTHSPDTAMLTSSISRAQPASRAANTTTFGTAT